MEPGILPTDTLLKGNEAQPTENEEEKKNNHVVVEQPKATNTNNTGVSTCDIPCGCCWVSPPCNDEIHTHCCCCCCFGCDDCNDCHCCECVNCCDGCDGCDVCDLCGDCGDCDCDCGGYYSNLVLDREISGKDT